MSDRAPYSRVYWSVLDDPKFDGIRSDCRLMGAWTLMLIAADMAHPAPAYLLPTVPRSALTKLVEAGLVDVLEDHRYRIHGLSAERERRRVLATTRGPLADRTGTGRSPDGDHSGSKAEAVAVAEAETRQRQEAEADGRDDLEAFLLVRRRAPSPGQRRILDDVLARHDMTGPAWAARIILDHPDDPIGAVLEADKAYRAERIAEAQAAERPKPTPRRRPGLPETTRQILAEMKLLEQEKVS